MFNSLFDITGPVAVLQRDGQGAIEMRTGVPVLVNRNERLDLSDLSEAGIAGVHPAKQHRSRAMESRLLVAGRVCLDSGDLEALNIDDVCASADCTVGAFYSRFESKEAFFTALQFVICRERDIEVKQLLRQSSGMAVRAGVQRSHHRPDEMVPAQTTAYCALPFSTWKTVKMPGRP